MFNCIGENIQLKMMHFSTQNTNIIFSWGSHLSEALSQLVMAMFGYMTSISSIHTNEEESIEYGMGLRAHGHDLHSLIYAFLDEWLVQFHCTGFVPRTVTIEELDSNSRFFVVSSGEGECFDIDRHPQYAEVKAITYSNMKVVEEKDKVDVWVIVDI